MLNVYEVLDQLKNFKSEEEAALFLRSKVEECPPLLDVLKATYLPGVHFAIERVPFYKPSSYPPGLAPVGMTAAIRQSYMFQPNHPNNPNLPEQKMKMKLVSILEGMEAQEAVVYMNMLLKDLRYPSLSAKIVKLAFPNEF